MTTIYRVNGANGCLEKEDKSQLSDGWRQKQVRIKDDNEKWLTNRL